MRITKGQLRKIIQEEANRANLSRKSRLYESDQIDAIPTVDLMDQAAQAIFDRNKSKLENIINQLETMGPNHKPSQAFINMLEMAIDVIEETEYHDSDPPDVYPDSYFD